MTKTANPGTYQLTYSSSDGLYHSSPILPPQQVQGLSVGIITTTSIALSWSPAGAGTYPVAGYNVYSSGTLLASTATINYTATGLSTGTAYTFTVAAYDSQGTPLVSAASSPVTATTTSVAVPGPVGSFTSTATSSSTVSLSWTAATGATSYSLTRNGSAIVSGFTGLSYGDSGLTASTLYSYVLTPVNATGNGPTASASATTSASSGTGPLLFQQVYDLQSAASSQITAATYSGTTATLTFSAPTSGAISPANSVTFTAGSASITFASNNLQANQSVIFAAASGTLPSNITAGTVYYVSATGLSSAAFQVALTAGGTPIVAAGAPAAGTTVSTMMSVTVQGIGGATGYNGTYVVTGGSSSTVSYILPTAPGGTPVFNGSPKAWLTIIQTFALCDANGNTAVQGSAFTAPVLVQGGTPPYTYSFYASPQATTVAGSGPSGYVGTAQNVWAINSSTGVITGTPGVVEADELYIQITDSASNTIQSVFAIGVVATGVGAGYYAALTGSALRNAIFNNLAVGGAVTIPSWLTTAPSGFTISYPTAPLTLTTGQKTVTPLTSPSTQISIPGGTTPFTCNTSNATYTLQGNLSCPGVCITIGSTVANILINLNGYTLTYATAPVQPTGQYSIDACGIGLSANYSSGGNGTIEIINGQIFSGAGRTVNALQGLYGIAPCPIRIYQVAIAGLTLYVRGVYFKWNNYSAGAMGISSSTINTNSLVEYCTFEDYGWIVQNRAVGVYVFGGFDGIANIRNNRVVHARHCITGPCLNVYNNDFWMDTWATNGAIVSVNDVSVASTSGCQVYNNNMYMTGCHPESVWINGSFPSTSPSNTYSNWIEGMYTRVGNQLASATGGLDDAENYADAITMKFGAPSYNNVTNNMMWTHAKTATVWNPKSNVYQNSTARGLYYEGAKPGLTANNFTGNMLAATTADTGTSSNNCWVLGCSGTGDGLTISGNRLVTNRCHFYMADVYGYSLGFAGASSITGNYIELPSVGAGVSYANFRNDAEFSWGSASTPFALTALPTTTGTSVTITYAYTPSYPGWGNPIIVSGIVGGTGFNGTFPGSAITSISSTSITYTSTTTGSATSYSGANVWGQIVVSPTFTANTWVHGTWNGPTTPGSYSGTITGTSGGASGTTPVSYSNLGPNMTYTFVNEPGAIL